HPPPLLSRPKVSPDIRSVRPSGLRNVETIRSSQRSPIQTSRNIRSRRNTRPDQPGQEVLQLGTRERNAARRTRTIDRGGGQEIRAARPLLRCRLVQNRHSRRLQDFYQITSS